MREARMKITDERVERAARAIDPEAFGLADSLTEVITDRDEARFRARAAIAAVAPLILEEAAKVADFGGIREQSNHDIAAAIRALSPTSHTSPEE